MGTGRALKSPSFSARLGRAAAAGPRHSWWLGLLLLAGCQTVTPAGQAESAAAHRGRVFAQTSCASCHETRLYGTSPNPNAPPFGAIANQEGVTAETLSYWLRSAHNYPIEMNFLLHDDQVDALVAYFLSLRVRDYRRPADL